MYEILLLGGMMVVSIALIAYSLLPGRKEKEEVLLRRMSGRKTGETENPVRKAAKESAAQKVLEKFAPLAVKAGMPRSDEDISTLRVKLATAGYRRETAPAMFLASKTILGVLLGSLTLALMWTSGHDLSKVLGVTALVGAVGFLLPNVWLRLATSQRCEKIRNGLPDSLDLMVISVEAGLGLDAAIQRVGDEMRRVHPELSEEMTIASVETQMGVPRAEALANMAARSGVAEMKALVAVITQAEKFGTSIAKALRNQADSLRTKRRLKAEERAQKTAVKLMLPLVLFIFPAMFVVLLGPAIIQAVRVFSKAGF